MVWSTKEAPRPPHVNVMPPITIIHGVPLSQPFRSVVWPCLIKNVKIRLEVATPGAGGKHSTRRSEYLSSFPLGTIPSIEHIDGNDTKGGSSAKKFCLSEAPAILAYLSAKNNWEDIYPTDISSRAKVDEYLHWHHSNLRSVTKGYFRPRVFPHALLSDDLINAHKREAAHALKVLERSYLQRCSTTGNDNFLLGTSHPTAADFMAYEEVVQLQMCNLHVDALDRNDYPNIYTWMAKMRSLPYHDEVHAALEELGDLNKNHDVGSPPMRERLALASKVGLRALKAAMQQHESMARL